MDGNRRWFFASGGVLAGISLVLLLAGADLRVLLLARNTLYLAAGTCAVSVPIGTLLALLLVRTDVPLRRSILTLWIALLFVPLYLQAAAWGAGFGKLGWYSLATETFGSPLLQGWLAAIWIHGLASIAWVIVIVGAAVRLSEPELEEEALLYGSGLWVAWHVTLRRALPGIMVAVLWIAVTTSGDMTVTDLYQIRTFAEELYTGFALGDIESGTPGLWRSMLASGVLAGVTMMVTSMLVGASIHVPLRAPLLFRLGRRRWLAGLFVFVVLLLAIGVPLGNLVYKAGLVVEQVGDHHVRCWSFAKFARLLIPMPGTYELAAVWRFRREFRWTLALGATVATVCLVMATPLAWWARRGGARAVPAVIAIACGLAVSGPLVGLAVIWLGTRSNASWSIWLFDHTLFAPALAVSMRSLPLCLLVCWTALSTLNQSILDAAALDGAGPVARFLYIALAQRKAALLVAWLVAFAVACGELACSVLAAPPGVTTVVVRVFGLLHAGVDDQVATICLTSVFGFLILGVLVQVIGSVAVRRGQS